MDLDMVSVLAKALDTTSTNGNAFLTPTFLSKLISEQVRTVPALRNAIPRIPWPTRVYNWDVVTDFGLASTYTDGGTINLSDATFTQSSAAMSYFAYPFYVTNPAILSDQELVDVVSMRLGQATANTLRLEGQYIYSGDPNNAAYGGGGLKAALQGGANGNIIGSGATAYFSMFRQMDIALRAQGYMPGAWTVTPNVYSLLMGAAYNNVRFIGVADQTAVGFPLQQGALSINGIPVIMDTYAQTIVAVASATMVGSGSAYQFASGGKALPNQGSVFTNAGSNFAGTTWSAPVITVSSVVQPASAYTITSNGVTFASNPGATPVATFSYAQENVYLLSLNPKDLCIAELQGICVDADLGKPVQTDSLPFRVRQYNTLAVRDTKAHVGAWNVALPTLANFINN